MADDLSSFIDRVYREPYSLVHNNCIHKSLKIRRKALELGKRADLIFCISIVRIKEWHNLLTVNPHAYVEIEGRKVDVSLDPEHEQRYCLNREKRLLLPVNISRIGRRLRGVRDTVKGFWMERQRDSHGY